MNQTLAIAIFGPAGAILVALVGLAGGRLASRDARQAAREASKVAAAIDNRKVGREEFDSITRELRSLLDTVKADLEHEQEQRRLSNGYARTLAQVLRDHDMPVPLAPAGLDLN